MTDLTMQYDSINNTWSYEEQPQMQVEVVLASKPKFSVNHKPIFTVRMRYPRPLHGEIMTHRMFSRNARSSRAVPVKTMLNEVRNIPYVPWHWGLNQSGMQADEECHELILLNWDEEIGDEDWATRQDAWLEARDHAVRIAEGFMNAGYHKQNPNRLLEPFSWIDTLITSTDWDNFLWLREHGAAEPHLQDLAALVHTALVNAEVQEIGYDEWHCPYISKMDIQNLIIRPDDDTERLIDELGCDDNELLNMVSSARCARISYKPFDGDSSYRREFERYDMLVTSDRVHASPTEHQAQPDHLIDFGGKVFFENVALHGNLDGYIQYRKLIPNECFTGSII